MNDNERCTCDHCAECIHDMKAEREALRCGLAEAKELISKLSSRVWAAKDGNDSLRAQLDTAWLTLRRYAKCDFGCGTDEGGDCTCGRDAAMAQLKENQWTNES